MSVSLKNQNRALLHRWFNEVWNKGNYDAAYEVVDPNFTVHGAGGQSVKQGPAGVIALVQTWRSAFPDGQMSIDGLLVEDDLVATLLTWRGTHRGAFYGVPASGKRVVVTSIGIDRISNGKVVEGWGEVDMLGMLRQIGAIPTEPQQPPMSNEIREHSWPRFEPRQDISSSPAERQRNKDLMLRLIKAVNDNDFEAFKATVDPDHYTENNPSLGVLSLDDAWRTYTTMRSALPDLHFEPDLDIMVAEGDGVAARGVVTGTHAGSPLFGVPPTGKHIEWTGIDISRVVNGKVVERWLCADILRIMQQIDLVPPLGS